MEMLPTIKSQVVHSCSPNFGILLPACSQYFTNGNCFVALNSSKFYLSCPCTTEALQNLTKNSSVELKMA